MMQKIVLLSILLIVKLAAGNPSEAIPFKGTKKEGTKCFSEGECLEPFYCLKVGEEYRCAEKVCTAQNMCHIGQFCDEEAEKCSVRKCEIDEECPGQTVCQTNEKCGPKSNFDQTCTRDTQCWSEDCSDGRCLAPESETGSRGYGKISGGGIAGIIIGILALLAILGALCWFLSRSGRNAANGGTR